MTKVIVVCDCYSAYKKLARLNAAIILAFCWAHVRRDFLGIALGFPTLKEWALEWVDAIGTLDHLNQQRLTHWQETLPLAQQGMPFQQAQHRLEHQVEQMRERYAQFLQADQAATSSSRTTVKPPSTTTDGKTVPVYRLEELHIAQRHALASLHTHWQGLTVFVTHPEVPMDNNSAEQSIRNSVTGRKNIPASPLCLLLNSFFSL